MKSPWVQGREIQVGDIVRLKDTERSTNLRQVMRKFNLENRFTVELIHHIGTINTQL